MKITFDTANNCIIITHPDGTQIIYLQSDKDKYLFDTGRIADVLAMGW